MVKVKNNLTDEFIEFLWNFVQKEMQPNLKKEIQYTLVDFLGSYFAGVKIGGLKVKKLVDLVESNDNYHALGIHNKLSLENAALINGILGHYAELDDGHRKGLLHPGVVIFSSLLAWHQKYPISTNNFFKAVSLGYEASIRLAEAVQPKAKLKGFHGTGVFGTIGAALACAVAADATRSQLKNTLSVAATSASGILRVIKNTSELKPFNAGNAAKNAVSAAQIGLAGFDGPIEVLDGSLGFLTIFDADFKKNSLLVKDAKPKLFDIYRKPYAACRHCHPAIDIALSFKAQIELGDISKVKIKTYGIGIPGHEHTDIVGGNSAKMSTPYSFAVALHTGKAGLEQFEKKYYENEEVLQLAQKVTLEPDAYFDKHFPGLRGAEIELKLNSGKTIIEKVNLPKGEPETALTYLEIENKFLSYTTFLGIKEENANLIFRSCTKDKFDLLHVLDNVQKLNLMND